MNTLLTPNGTMTDIEIYVASVSAPTRQEQVQTLENALRELPYVK